MNRRRVDTLVELRRFWVTSVKPGQTVLGLTYQTSGPVSDSFTPDWDGGDSFERLSNKIYHAVARGGSVRNF